MKKHLISLTISLACTAAALAQPGVFATRPGSNPGGRMLTQMDLYKTGALSRTSQYHRWVSGFTFAYYTGHMWKYAEVSRTGDCTPGLRPGKGPEMPADASCTAVSGRKGAYSVGGSLWWVDEYGRRTLIAEGSDGIVYGETVSRNEFGIEGGIFWSPDGRKIAFYRKDETRVTKFPLLDITTRTGSLREIRYPMNGMDSELITLGVYDTVTGKTVWMDVDDFTQERYLTNVSWTPDSRQIWIQVLARSQHEMHLNSYSADSGRKLRTLLTEENDAWVEPLDPIRFLGERSDVFLYRTDNRDGYRSFYLCDTLGSPLRRITPAPADAAYAGHTATALYYTSAEISPIENHMFRVDLKVPEKGKKILEKAKIGKPFRMTKEPGWHEIELNVDCSLYLDHYSNLTTPGVTNLRSTAGHIYNELYRSADPFVGFAECEVSLGTVKSADGKYDNYYRIVKPLGFDPSKKYPVIVYVYGGPHSQMVQNSWLGELQPWEMLMAQKGYIVYVQDNRGTSNRGAAYEKAINRECGKAEMADQMMGIEMLKEQPWVDAGRIGVHGWSYGGFMTISLMTHYPTTFKVGVAGGPVIDWKWYEVMYGERYMDNPETNPQGFEKTSLIGRSNYLLGKLLICQGAMDNTCVWQHSLSFIEDCIENYVPVDYFPYPRAEHNVRPPLRAHLMDKVTQYFEDYL